MLPPQICRNSDLSAGHKAPPYGRGFLNLLPLGTVGVKTDVSRFPAQVINGVGFLGAGTILVTGRQEVKGLTTAACLWASACMGIAIGAGFYECVLVGSVLIVITIMRL